jgi:hypothetical protein
MSKRHSNIVIEEYYDFTYGVWADEGMLKTIKSVEGVALVSLRSECNTRYTVDIDKRYDAKSVLDSIKNAIILAMRDDKERMPQ